MIEMRRLKQFQTNLSFVLSRKIFHMVLKRFSK